MLFLLVLSFFHSYHQYEARFDDRRQTVEAPPYAVSAADPYDEQLALTFGQNFTKMAVNVTTVEQSGADGVGPAYLLNGLTDVNYWYQVGLSWDWVKANGGYIAGFNANYEAFAPNGTSIYPSLASGMEVVATNVVQGDVVLLSLFFHDQLVAMSVHNWRTNSTYTRSYDAFGSALFIGLPRIYSQHGFFTGLMTEEYHASPYFGPEQTEIYSSAIALSSALMWMDEYNALNHKLVFNYSTSLISYNNPSEYHYLSGSGTGEASNGYFFITGSSNATGIFDPFLKVLTSPFIEAGIIASIVGIAAITIFAIYKGKRVSC